MTSSKYKSLLSLTITVLACHSLNARAQSITISKTVNSSPLVITASVGQFAGAINSITYRGQQYIDAYDHGRELQSASSFDGLGECFNPTEAGSSADNTGATSSSILQSISGYNNVIQSQTKMAFWLAPGEPYGGHCGSTTKTSAQNTTVVSNHILSKKVSIGLNGISNLISYDVSFYVAEGHTSGAFEAETAYMPISFNTFLSYDKNAKVLKLLDASGWVGSSLPIIVSTANGANAMAILASDSGVRSGYTFHYEYHFFPNQASKQGCVYGKTSIPAGTVLNFSCPIAIGSVDEVIAAINAYPSAAANTDLPIYRFRFDGGHHFYTRSYSEGAGAGFSLDGPIWHTFATNSGSLVPLYRCAAGSNRNDHFVSIDGNCEGYFTEGSLGYISTSTGANLLPLYRFYRASLGDHLITTNYNEGTSNGYTFEYTVGYVPVK